VRRSAIATVLVAVCVLAACGSDDGEPEEAGGAASSELDAVIDDFGQALFAGDIEAVIALLPPDDRGDVDTDGLEDLNPVAGQIEIRDLGHVIVSETSSSAEATYTGQRCAPDVASESSESSGSGQGAGEGEGEESVAEETTTDETAVGEVVCLDIAEEYDGEPFEFVRVDGQWYGTLPGVGGG
jgi:hypothetical protein